MKKYIPKNSSYLWIILIFLLWRVLLLAPFVFTPEFLPLQATYLGGELDNYSQYPHLWGWANFDGQHYLSIAQFGYRPLTYFFFPLYPILMQKLQLILGNLPFPYLLSGLVISNVSFLLSLIGLYKLLLLDYKKRIVWMTLLLLLVFPTAFYFGSVYTESIFLALIVWSFYMARKRMWLGAVILAAFATSARLVGIIMLPALLIEYLVQCRDRKERVSVTTLILLMLIPLGIGIYMLFLQKTTGDSLAFFHSVEIFGEQRSSHLIMLPQVFYRYVFKILPAVNLAYLPGAWISWLEMIVGALFLLLSMLAFWKTRISYAIFGLGAYLIPTLSGSFSSLPRYVLVAFPAFLVFSIFMRKHPKIFVLVLLILLVCLLYTESLFVRGYWVA